MHRYQFDFAAEVTEEQRLLNGTRSLTLEGEAEADGGCWTLTLNLVQPKDAEAPLDEGDLTLSGPIGELVAALETGQITAEVDDLTGGEREALDLRLRVEDGDGAFGVAEGTARVRGVLNGAEAELRIEVEVERAIEE